MPVPTYLPTSNGITIKWERVTKSSLFFLSLEHPDSVRNSMKIFGIQTFPLQPNFTRRMHKFCEFIPSDFCRCNIACGTICGASWTRLQERPYNWIYSLRLLLMQYCSTICGASWTDCRWGLPCDWLQRPNWTELKPEETQNFQPYSHDRPEVRNRFG